ncbi:YdeI/OmpD-associated family protein [Parerythrobacter lacustris]|uniref:YdeI/OmpD-associated family protein n=1 Tax=Parerythrobacter lacustris TaxID=2969984 RepID=A0ABT1XQU8_9SPHN|nr:YdeI/OmpD-associated family protein [Parerythrobacter lacustris]MCR2834033.1 YdeI/OmpD-associated family protein [Parerythrobacter lacustris]
MGKDKRVDDYIAKAGAFARPILIELRARIHRALPDAEEGIKWGMPHFMVRGKNVAGIAAFKAHCALVIHGEGQQGDALGGYGRIASIDDMPPESELVAAIKNAVERVETHGSATTGRDKPAPKPEIPMPDDFAAVLADNPQAKAAFDGMAPSHRREYLEWITGAKRAATREKRMATAIEWLAEGKKRNWKYENC